MVIMSEIIHTAQTTQTMEIHKAKLLNVSTITKQGLWKQDRRYSQNDKTKYFSSIFTLRLCVSLYSIMYRILYEIYTNIFLSFLSFILSLCNSSFLKYFFSAKVSMNFLCLLFYFPIAFAPLILHFLFSSFSSVMVFSWKISNFFFWLFAKWICSGLSICK